MDRNAAAQLFNIPAATADGQYLVLRAYVSARPQRYFNRQIQSVFAEWFEDRHSRQNGALHEYLDSHLAEIDQALLFLHEINVEDWHDRRLDRTNDWEFWRFVDHRIHRTYLRLVEAVLTPLARLTAHFSRRDRGVGTEGLDIYAISEELANTPLSLLTAHYHHTVRNGIGHGGITYGQFEIAYRDGRGNEAVLDRREIVDLCDNLLDDCNGLAAALAVFYVLHREAGYPIPEEVLLQELREETATPWWTIDGTIRSIIPSGDQLVIYAQTRRRDFATVQFSALQTGILAECFAPGYARYFVSIRGESEGTGWAALDGERLHEHRVAGDDLTKYTDVVESIAFLPLRNQPGWLRRIWNVSQAFQINWPYARREWQAARGIPEIIARTATLHRNEWHSVLNGAVVMPEASPSDVRKWRRKITRTAMSAAIPERRVDRFLPLGYSQISVFSRDYRSRRLASYGLGPDLVCTVRYQNIGRIHSPDIMGSTVETSGSWRIAWNRAWLEREAVTLDTPAPWRVMPAD